MGVGYITFAGGEPLLYEQLAEAVKYAKDSGFVVTMTTNGSLVTEKTARELVDAGIDGVGVSLDYPGEKYDEIRNTANAFKKADNAIALLSSMKKGGKPDVSISAVITQYNYDKLDELFEYSEKRGVDFVALQPYIRSWLREEKNMQKLFLSDEQISVFEQKLKEVYKKYGKMLQNSKFFTDSIAPYFRNGYRPEVACFSGVTNIVIFPEGGIGVCPGLGATGNLKSEKLDRILASDKFSEMRNNARRLKCSGCLCPINHEPNILFRPGALLKELPFLIRKMAAR
jgi:pyrroloquinoline quinone biosynthesis protein E